MTTHYPPVLRLWFNPQVMSTLRSRQSSTVLTHPCLTLISHTAHEVPLPPTAWHFAFCLDQHRQNRNQELPKRAVLDLLRATFKK